MKRISDLHGKNIVVFDLEIAEPIDHLRVRFEDPASMTVSVGVLFDYMTGDYSVHMQENMHELIDRINRADLVVGYNINDFDIPLLRAHYDLRADLPCYDVLREVRLATGWRPGSVYRPKGCKLDDVLLATFGRKLLKTEGGHDAPHFFQTGQIGKLISYAIADVRRERLVFEESYLRERLFTATHGRHRMPCPLRRIR